MLARCWRDCQGVSNSLLILSIGAPGNPPSRIEHPYRAEFDSERFVEARTPEGLGHPRPATPPDRIPCLLNVHCYQRININRSENRF